MGAIEVHKVVSHVQRDQPHAPSNVHRLLVRPIAQPKRSIDATEAMTRAIAHCLWEQVGGNDALNWLEAERLVQEMLRRFSGNDAAVGSPADTAFAIAEATAQRARMTIEPKDGTGAPSVSEAELAGAELHNAA